MIGIALIAIVVTAIPGMIVLIFYLMLRQTEMPPFLDIVEWQKDRHRLERVEQEMTLFWRLVERSLAGRLHAPTHKLLDSLLLKLQEGTVTEEECVQLRVLIQDRAEELIVEGIHQPDLEFPRLMTLWAIDVRLAAAGRLPVSRGKP